MDDLCVCVGGGVVYVFFYTPLSSSKKGLWLLGRTMMSCTSKQGLRGGGEETSNSVLVLGLKYGKSRTAVQ